MLSVRGGGRTTSESETRHEEYGGKERDPNIHGGIIYLKIKIGMVCVMCVCARISSEKLSFSFFFKRNVRGDNICVSSPYRESRRDRRRP